VVRKHNQEIVAQDSSSGANAQNVSQSGVDELGYRLPGMGDENQFELESGAAGVPRTLFGQMSSHGQSKLAEDDYDFGSPQLSDALEHSAAEHCTTAAGVAPNGTHSHSSAPALHVRAGSDLGLDEGLLQHGGSPCRSGLHRTESDPSPTQGDREPPSFGGGGQPQCTAITNCYPVCGTKRPHQQS